MSDNDVFDSIAGASGASARFPAVGATVEGVILRVSRKQATVFGTKEPKFWKSGDPVMVSIFALQTEERDPEIEDDDGLRNLYVESIRMREAIKEALKAAGFKRGDTFAGATLKVQYVGDGEPTAGASAPKLYRAKFTPPPAAHTDDEFSSDPF